MAKSAAGNHPTIDTLRERMNRDPFSRAFLQLAEEYRKTGQYDEAVKVCLEGLSRHPTYHTARISLGRTYLEAGDLESARRTLAEVLELMPENHLAGKLLAEVQRKTGDLQGAAETYRGILRHYPADREIETLLRDLQGGVAAAPAELPGSIAPVEPPGPLTPAAVPAVARLVPAVDYLPEDIVPGALPPAPPAGPTAVEAQETDALQTNTLAELYLRQGLVDKAIEVYRAMLRVDPSNHKARQRLGDLAPGLLEATPSQVRHVTEELAAIPAAPKSMPAPAVASAPVLPAIPPPPVTPPGVGERARREKIARLERWLLAVRSPGGSTAGDPGA